MVGDEGIFTLWVGCLVGLFQMLPALLSDLGLLESLSKRRYRNVLIPSLTLVILLYATQDKLKQVN